MKFDEIVQSLGEFGTYQKRVFFLLCVASMSCGIQIMISVFTLGVPKHRCALPDLANDTSYHSVDASHLALLNASISWDLNLGETGAWSQCQVKVIDDVTGESRQQGCQRWVYDDSVFTSTVVSKFDLVCEKKGYIAMTRMILMGGLVVGALSTGVLADWIGRKSALMLMVLLHGASSIAVAWANSLALYIVIRFFTGVSISGLFLAVFVLGMELVGPSKRMFVGIVVEVFWALGVMILGAIAYCIRDWNYLQMAVSFPILLLLGYWWTIPESPRWLLARGRDEAAEKIIRHAAKVNGSVLPEKLFDNKTFDEAYQREKLSHAFTSPRFMIRLVIICYCWLVCAMVFYGLSLNAGKLAGDIYINFELLGLMEISAYGLCLMLLNRVGRKPMQIACMVVGGGACLSTIFVVVFADKSLEWINIALSLLGKFGASAAFAIIFVYSAELFPTILRNSLMGVACLFARVGGMISPYIADLNNAVDGPFGKALPLIVFGASTVAGGLLCLWLPETLNRHLPETLDDATNFGRMRSGRRRQRELSETGFSEKKENHPLTRPEHQQSV